MLSSFTILICHTELSDGLYLDVKLIRKLIGTKIDLTSSHKLRKELT